ncbi:Type-I restriction modification system methylase [Desulfonema limicola]|uniref:Type-I restriction modification system methylase n=1 Tax=Desulfonema limicola TaxID=45656 RepID=A0A975GII5_9BACT|nr:restriction endonuclease subunit S [Desulfonema limicola]QTA82602.1 Type-I restriction modification system methylase [Desulfonema limicola]
MDVWKNIKLVNYINILSGFAFNSDFFTGEEGTPLIRIRDINKRNTDINFSGKFSDKYLIKKGDLLIGMDGDFEVAQWKGENALLNQRVCKIESNDKNRLNQIFLFYRIINEIKLINNIISATTVKHLSTKDIDNIQVNLPPIDEQTKIAAILSKTDKAIEQTERIIAKYQRIKTGLMQDLLTKGIDENGNIRSEETHEFKDSPVGRIPVEWNAVYMDEILYNIEAGKSPNCIDVPAGSGQWGVLKVSAVRPEGFQSEENKVLENSNFINPKYEVKDKDLLITRSNTYDLVGIVCLVKNPPPNLLLCDKTLRLIINKNKSSVDFIFYVLQMPFVRSQIEIHATGSSGSMKNISQETIRHLIVPRPEKTEQTNIYKILNKIDKYIKDEKKQLNKMRRKKTGLMQDLLTGKVRCLNLDLPD